MDLNSKSLGIREVKSHSWRQGSVVLQKPSAIPHSIICWKITSQKADNKNWSYHLRTPPLSSNWTFLQTELDVSVFQYLPKGMGLAAKEKQEMAWKLIKLAENSFYASDQILQGPELPPGYRNRKFGNRKRQYSFELQSRFVENVIKWNA